MRIRLKKIISIALTLTLSLGIVGCSKDSGKSSMGRYVEERYQVPEGVEVQNLSLLDNDKIGMIGYSTEDFTPVAFVSEDGGKTWTEEAIELPKEEGKETYTNNIGYLSDGTILLSYYFQEPVTEMEEGVVDDSMSVDSDDGAISEEFTYEEPEYKYATVDTDGNLTDIDLDLSIYNDDDSMEMGYNNFKCSLNGDVFFTAGSNNEKVVQFDGETFEEKNIYEGGEWINDFFLVGDSLVIYEFDSIGEKRSNQGSSIDKENNRIITTLLNEMDGFSSLNGVVVIAATNSYQSLDAALVRPGRFDLKYTISNPDKDTRGELIDIYTKGKPLAPELTRDMLINAFNGLSCAAIESILNEAISLMIQTEQKAIDARLINQAAIRIREKLK